MHNQIKFDYSKSIDFIQEQDWLQFESATRHAHQLLHHKSGVGAESLGWLNPGDYSQQKVIKQIQSVAKKIMEDTEVFVVIGVGGSYLGARAAIDMLSHHFYNQLPKEKRKTPEIYFVGNQFSSDYMTDLLEIIADKEVSIHVISKSGTTTETAIAFRIFKKFIEKRYGVQGARERIFVTTAADKGVLRTLANEEGFTTFVIPDDVGGRYSVLTSVGLLPIAVAGIQIEEMLAGAQTAAECYAVNDLNQNQCYQYASIRNALYRKGKIIELFISYEPSLHYFAEWWKQLFGESEGKDHKGIFPTSLQYSTDLHAVGQYIQEGQRNLFETIIWVENANHTVTIPQDQRNLDQLNYLADKNLNFVNKQAFEGTMFAHMDGGVPNLVIGIQDRTPFTFGQLVYFFEKACAMSGYILGVNPFDQPGVEAYKSNMFALLGKPGYEKRLLELQDRINNKGGLSKKSVV
ncbi:glucose-6-phosphate isomerase [Hazenella sp. IB182357]|uniref:Glucose-6-phosphate isomerase n=1 Tax=Polycladospora coralii TaxID=2771432 RepID=A0A926N7D9_9BACL|nr:glucose-6-phosphate isomerase [Polycladospora coralii]MBD1373286.1 glucose-6-phosphate isomerase [Polycladospora coralii]MBS7528901.1 glucose-6-phosphate isomerase [Polycladospora coralii]